MPKVVRDEKLAARVRSFVEQRGSVSAAAAALGVDRTLLWRFNRTGCAIERTRAVFAAALEQYEKETSAGKSATSAAPAGLQPSVSVADLIAIRAFLQNMLNVIDAYPANPAGSAAAAELAHSIATSKATHAENVPKMGGQNGQP